MNKDRYRFKKLRTKIAEQVTDRFVQSNPIFKAHLKLTDITDHALNKLRQWEQNPDPSRRLGDADMWKHYRTKFRISYSRRMELAIWLDDDLCAVMLGKPSKGRLTLKVDYLEGNYHSTALTGMRMHIALLYAEAYATALNIKWVGIQSPYSSAIPLYEEEGYIKKDPFNKKNDAIFKQL